jgi:hypothetical protein
VPSLLGVPDRLSRPGVLGGDESRSGVVDPRRGVLPLRGVDGGDGEEEDVIVEGVRLRSLPPLIINPPPLGVGVLPNTLPPTVVSDPVLAVLLPLVIGGVTSLVGATSTSALRLRSREGEESMLFMEDTGEEKK